MLCCFQCFVAGMFKNSARFTGKPLCRRNAKITTLTFANRFWSAHFWRWYCDYYIFKDVETCGRLPFWIWLPIPNLPFTCSAASTFLNQFLRLPYCHLTLHLTYAHENVDMSICNGSFTFFRLLCFGCDFDCGFGQPVTVSVWNLAQKKTSICINPLAFLYQFSLNHCSEKHAKRFVLSFHFLRAHDSSSK